MATEHKEIELREQRDVEAGVEGIPIFDGDYDKLPTIPPQPCCAGCGCFCTMTWICLLVTIVAPIILFAVAADTDFVSTVRALAAVCIVVGILGCCGYTWQLWWGGALHMPPAPAPQAPTPNAHVGPRKTFRKQVKKIYVLVNPASGVMQGTTMLQTCKSRWEAAGIEVVVVETQRRGHATELGRTLPTAGFDAMVVIGGDGSLFETLNGMLARPEAERIPLGLIPGGSGNSTLRDMEVHGHTEEGLDTAIQRVIDGDVCYLDCNEIIMDNRVRIFSMNELTWGLTGDVGSIAEEWRGLGPGRYDVCAVWLTLRGASRKCRVDYDGETIQGNLATAFVNNTQYFGKALRACPTAALDDGLCDLVVLRETGRASLFEIFNQMPEGRQIHNRNIQFIKAKHVTITPADAGVVNIDGENFAYTKSLDIRCLHKQFQFLVPPDVNKVPGTA